MPSAGRNAQTLKTNWIPVPVGERAEQRGADAADAEDEAEEQAGDHADATQHQLLAEDDDRGERRGEDEADDDAQVGCEKSGERLDHS